MVCTNNLTLVLDSSVSELAFDSVLFTCDGDIVLAAFKRLKKFV